MDSWLNDFILFLGIVLVQLAALFVYWRFFSRPSSLQRDLRDLEREKIELASQIHALQEERERLLQEARDLKERLIQRERDSATFESEKKSLQEKLHAHHEDLKQLQEQFKNQFENLAQQIFEQKTKIFYEHSQKNILAILDPLKEKLQEFQKRVEETYSKESRDRFALQKEIEKIVQSSQQMTLETSHLTRALRGDVKAQGNWGEIVLERVLEASGLREGQEYTLQGKELQLTDSEGKRLRPDVIINLPDQKHIIIDSKVSLIHYERYVTEEEESKKTAHLRDYLNSLYAQLDNLAGKNYQNLENLGTPNFVLMFVPIEGAFSLAVQGDAQLFNYAWDKLIVIVSPTTLLATLRTVASLWKQERQNQNALEIARQGGQLYDKFMGFFADLEKVGDFLSRSQNVYLEAMNKLKHGRGNILSKVENLKKLGAKTTKSLPQEYLLVDDDGDSPESEELPPEERVPPSLSQKNF